MAAAPNPASGPDIGIWPAVIAAGSFLLQLVMNIGTFVWVLIRSKSATDQKIADKDKAFAGDLGELERRMQDRVAAVERDCGEMGQALRQKISETEAKTTQVELWNRDNFVSKQTFNAVVGDLRRALEKLVDRVDERFDRLEDKLDERSAK